MGDLHLGFTPWVGDLSGHAHDIADQAAHGESLGYQSLWLPESHFLPRGSSPSPLLPLAAAAARTTTLKLGTTSYLLPIRHPLHVAEDVAVLDRISQGRVIIGLGRGFRPALFEAFGVPRSEKRARFESAVRTMIKAWAGEPIDTGGESLTRLAPLPVQKPHPPLWVAAFGPKALAQAARLGLPYLASPMESRQRLVANYALHRQALSDNGHPSDLAVPVMRTIFVSRDQSALGDAREALELQAAELMSTGFAANLGRTDLDEIDAWALIGEPESVADKLADYRETLGITHLIVRGHIPGIAPEVLAESLALLTELTS